MKLDYWKSFASKLNGQNIRLKYARDDALDAVNELEKLVDSETDLKKKESLEFSYENIRRVYNRLIEALDKNQVIKEVVKEDFYSGKETVNKKSYEIDWTEKITVNEEVPF